MPNAQDGRTRHAFTELCLSPGEELRQSRTIQAIADIEIGFLRMTGKPIPGADQLAIVATIDAVSHPAAQLFRNRAMQFNREVRDATPRVDLVRPYDRPCRAGVNAPRAAPAVFIDRRLNRQRQINVDFAQEEI